MGQYVYAMDVGGTFLDAIATDEHGAITTAKVLSTHDDYGRCVREAVQAIAGKLGLTERTFLESCRLIVNGTNAGDRIFVTGKKWPWLFQIEVVALSIGNKVIEGSILAARSGIEQGRPVRTLQGGRIGKRQQGHQQNP